MKTITLDVINQTAISKTAEGDVGVKLVVTNAPEEWGKCSVFALFTQGEQTRNELIKNPDGEYNVTTVPSAFTDANKAFKIGVYAIGADSSRDVRPSVWIRVMDTDFTTEDIIVTEQTLDDVLKIQALYTAYVESEEEREANEKARIEAENERVEAESQRKADISTMKQDISALQAEMKNKVDAEFGMGLSTNDFTDSDAMKLSDIEDDAQKNVQSDWNTSDTKSDAYIKNKPVIDQTYQSKSSNAQSGKAVAQAIAQLVGSAPETLDTIEEVAKAIAENEDVVVALESAIGNKADKTELDTKADKQTDYGGFAGGNKAGAVYGGAVGDEAKAAAGGAVGAYATAGDGGAVGAYASASYGGAVGDKAKAAAGGAVGDNAYTNYGGAVGCSASAGDGGAVGWYATTSDGFAGGYKAKARDIYGNAIDAIQLGTGTNNTPKSLQIYNYTLMNADGRIPAERMAVTPITEIPATLSPNQTYHFSEAPASIAFPSADVTDGDTIYLTFMTGDTPPTISIDMKNTTDIDIEIEADTGYEIYGKYVANINKWIVGYSSYKVPGGDEA